MKGRAVSYSQEELAWLEERKDWPRVTLHSVFVILFGREELTVNAIKALCTRKGWKTGRTGCFEQGIRPWNTGKSYTAPGSEKGWFKKGNRTGTANENYKPIGFERLSKDGYPERKIHDGMPLQSRWRAVHLIRWEALNGPIPKAHCLKCLDGDRTNTDPSNWELIHRAVLARLNGGPGSRRPKYNEVSPELRPTLLAVAKMGHQARRKRQAAADAG